MPRLPTIRVIGSQFISTRFFFFPETSGCAVNCVLMLRFPSSLERLRMIAGGEFGTGMPPLRFFVERVLGDGTQRSDHSSIGSRSTGGDFGTGRLVHERHELVREP